MPHLHIVAPAGTPPRILAALDALSDALVGGARAYDLSREEAICIQALLLGASAEELIASRDHGDSIASAILAGATIALTSAHASAAARADADKASAATPQDEPEIAALKRRRDLAGGCCPAPRVTAPSPPGSQRIRPRRILLGSRRAALFRRVGRRRD